MIDFAPTKPASDAVFRLRSVADLKNFKRRSGTHELKAIPFTIWLEVAYVPDLSRTYDVAIWRVSECKQAIALHYGRLQRQLSYDSS